MAVETLSQSLITFGSEIDNKISTPHSKPLVVSVSMKSLWSSEF